MLPELRGVLAVEARQASGDLALATNATSPSDAERRHADDASYNEVRLQKDDFLGCSRRSLLM